jgi:hypothetical protein
MRRYRIEVDGKPAGRLRPRGQLTVEVSPGAHRIQARIDWSGSPALGVHVSAGQTLSVYVGPPPGVSSPLRRALSSDAYLVLIPQRGSQDCD